MPGTGYGTDDEVMTAAVGQATVIAGLLRGTAATMSGQLEGELNDATWRGAASNAFTAVHDRMRFDMDNINNALDRLSSLVGAAAAGYRTTDDEGEGTVTRAGAAAGTTGSTLSW